MAILIWAAMVSPGTQYWLRSWSVVFALFNAGSGAGGSSGIFLGRPLAAAGLLSNDERVRIGDAPAASFCSIELFPMSEDDLVTSGYFFAK